jgi:hypothetical protein
MAKIHEGSVDELVFDDANPVIHSKKNKDAVKASVEEFGIIRSIAVDEDNRILAGNCLTEMAMENGTKKVVFVEADRDTIVAVKRSDLTEEEKVRYAIRDNQSAKLSIWNADNIIEHKNSGVSMKGIFTDADLERMANKKKDNDTPKVEAPAALDGEQKFYIIIECQDQPNQEELFEYLQDEGYKVMKYEGKEK